jgi:hypothetical protein
VTAFIEQTDASGICRNMAGVERISASWKVKYRACRLSRQRQNQPAQESHFLGVVLPQHVQHALEQHTLPRRRR